jgi:hypothetical protein
MRRLVILAVAVVVAPVVAACGLGSEGLSTVPDGSPASTDANEDAATGGGDDAAVLPGDAGGEGSDHSVVPADSGVDGTGPKADGSGAQEGGADAGPDQTTDAEPDDGASDADARPPPDATSSCIGSALSCPLLAVPCCTVTSSAYYGMCTPLALCR